MTLRTTRRDPGFALTERFLQYFTWTKVLVSNRTFTTVYFYFLLLSKRNGESREGKEDAHEGNKLEHAGHS
jgi:hypothetical protein